MPHIHEKIDFVTEAFVVHKNKVLIRKHDKYDMWLPVGGHIELDETPEEAVVREVKEEVGLEIELVDDYPKGEDPKTGFRGLMPPRFMNIHNISDTHRHISMVYFAKSTSDEIVDEGREKSGGCKWFTREDLEKNAEGLPESIKLYALKALEELGE